MQICLLFIFYSLIHTTVAKLNMTFQKFEFLTHDDVSQSVSGIWKDTLFLFAGINDGPNQVSSAWTLNLKQLKIKMMSPNTVQVFNDSVKWQSWTSNLTCVCGSQCYTQIQQNIYFYRHIFNSQNNNPSYLTIFDMETKTFSSYPSTNTLTGSCVVSNNQFIYILGGRTSSPPYIYYPSTLIFDISSVKWANNGPNMIMSRYNAGCSIDSNNNFMYVFGGNGSNITCDVSLNVGNSIEQYDLHATVNKKWKLLNFTLSTNRFNQYCFTNKYNGMIYCIGGRTCVYNKGSIIYPAINSTEIFDPSSLSSTLIISSMVISTYGFAPSLYQTTEYNAIFLVGGNYDTKTMLKTMQYFILAENATKFPTPEPTPEPTVEPTQVSRKHAWSIQLMGLNLNILQFTLMCIGLFIVLVILITVARKCCYKNRELNDDGQRANTMTRSEMQNEGVVPPENDRVAGTEYVN
eukprot:178317_1